jgi:hypothetical protein
MGESCVDDAPVRGPALGYTRLASFFELERELNKDGIRRTGRNQNY